MHHRSRFSAALVISTLFAASASAQAQQPSPQDSPSPSAPPLAPNEPAAPAPTLPAEVAPVAPSSNAPAPVLVLPAESARADAPRVEVADDPAVRSVLRAHAVHARRSRQIGGVTLLVAGAATAGAGLLADLEYDQEYGKVLWIGGAALGVSGLLSLFKTSPMEALEAESAAMSPASLHANWAAMADAARRARKISGVVGMSLGVIAGGAGGLIAAGVGDMERGAKQDWSIALISVGGALLGSGLTSFLVDSDVEVGYRAAYGSEPGKMQLSFGLSPTPGGAAGGVSARW